MNISFCNSTTKCLSAQSELPAPTVPESVEYQQAGFCVIKGDTEMRGDKGINYLRIISPHPNNPHISLLTLLCFIDSFSHLHNLNAIVVTEA
jgi:hypothetical protein